MTGVDTHGRYTVLGAVSDVLPVKVLVCLQWVYASAWHSRSCIVSLCASGASVNAAGAGI